MATRCVAECRLHPIEYGEKEKKRTFNDLRYEGQNLGALIEQLHPKRKRHEFCHLDPDVRQDILPGRVRRKNWLPLFGQDNSSKSASHLLKQGICEGDIFMFFGYFQESEGWNDFKHIKPKLHMIFGWLQVGEVIDNPAAWVKKKENRWAKEHPHTYGNWWKEPNLLFVARRNLIIPTPNGHRKTQLPGAGLFENYDDRLILTDLSPPRGIAVARSRWRLPEIFSLIEKVDQYHFYRMLRGGRFETNHSFA